jgi:hypothetical protein
VFVKHERLGKILSVLYWGFSKTKFNNEDRSEKDTNAIPETVNGPKKFCVLSQVQKAHSAKPSKRSDYSAAMITMTELGMSIDKLLDLSVDSSKRDFDLKLNKPQNNEIQNPLLCFFDGVIGFFAD